MKARLSFVALACIVAAFPSIIAKAQQAETTTPVLVLFNDDAPLQSFRGRYRPDPRARANPAAWDYLDRDVLGAVQALEAREQFRARHVYSAAIRGFAARLTAQQITALSNNPLVEFIEQDAAIAVSQKQSSGGGQIIPWGVDRIGAPTSSTRAGDGSGSVPNVNAYIIDSGIDATHPDLNVVNHVNFTDDGNNTDCNGHGTHVAGIAAAADNTLSVVSAAPDAPLTGVKVLGCSGGGWISDVVKGVDWVTKNAVRPAIANMSLAGNANRTLDRVVQRSASSGVLYAVGAGNNGADACNYSPARSGTAEGVITIAATNSTDQEASWSNYGPCVDLWAPGAGIVSTWLGGGTATRSGTSMAAPHVGGTAALFLSAHPTATPAEVERALKTDANSTRTASKNGQAIILVNASAY